MADFILSRVRSLSAPGRAIFYQGLAKQRPASRSGRFIKADLSRPASLNGRFIKNDRFSKAEDKGSGRDGRFINQKRPNGQISRFSPQMVPCKQFISHFYEGLAKPVAVLSRPASPNGRFKPMAVLSSTRASMAVLSTMAALSRPAQRLMAALSRPMAALSRRYKGGRIHSGALKHRV